MLRRLSALVEWFARESRKFGRNDTLLHTLRSLGMDPKFGPSPKVYFERLNESKGFALAAKAKVSRDEDEDDDKD